jgi:hypothetical protein
MNGSAIVYPSAIVENGLPNPHGTFFNNRMSFPTVESFMNAFIGNYMVAAEIGDHPLAPKMYSAAVRQDGDALRYVPESMKTPDLCFAAVRQDGEALQYVPTHMKTQAVCWAAINNDGRALEYVPESMKDYYLCMAAVENNGYAIEYVPDEKQTNEMLKTAVDYFLNN